eukprot:gene39064-51404_t
MVQVMLALKGIAFDVEVTLDQLLEAMGKAASGFGSGKAVDATPLLTPIIYDDFVELLCRLIISDHWIYDNNEHSPAPNSNNNNDHSDQRSVYSSHSTHHHKVISARLAS